MQIFNLQQWRTVHELCPLRSLLLWQSYQLLCRSRAAKDGGGGEPDRSLTPLHFQDTKMHRAAQAEHMEVQKRGNHGTLSAQLHNEKSNPPVVSILHVMFSVPVG